MKHISLSRLSLFHTCVFASFFFSFAQQMATRIITRCYYWSHTTSMFTPWLLFCIVLHCIRWKWKSPDCVRQTVQQRTGTYGFMNPTGLWQSIDQLHSRSHIHPDHSHIRTSPGQRDRSFTHQIIATKQILLFLATTIFRRQTTHNHPNNTWLPLVYIMLSRIRFSKRPKVFLLQVLVFLVTSKTLLVFAYCLSLILPLRETLISRQTLSLINCFTAFIILIAFPPSSQTPPLAWAWCVPSSFYATLARPSRSISTWSTELECLQSQIGCARSQMESESQCPQPQVNLT
jgi:hypothetical protein